MTHRQISKGLNEIIDKYWVEDYEYYCRYRYETIDGEETTIEARKEIEDFLSANNITFKSDYEYGYDSPGYDNSFYAVAYLAEGDNGDMELGLTTVVWESM